MDTDQNMTIKIKNTRISFKEYLLSKQMRIDKFKIDIALQLIEKSGNVSLDQIKDMFESIGRDREFTLMDLRHFITDSLKENDCSTVNANVLIK